MASAQTWKGPVWVVSTGGDRVKLLSALPARDGGMALDRAHTEVVARDADPVQVLSGQVAARKIKSVPVIGLIPRQQASIKIIELPSTQPAEIRDMVDLQVSKQTPYSKDEVFTAYRFLPCQREGYSRILLVVVQRSVLRHHYHLLESAGMAVRRMTITTEGLLAWCSAVLPKYGVADGAAAVIDIDSFYSEVVVAGAGGLVSSGSILVGSSQLAENLEIWRESFLAELRQLFEAARTEGGAAVTRVILTGAESACEVMADAVASLNVGVLREDALVVLPGSAETAEVSFASMAGAAMDPDACEFHMVPDFVQVRGEMVAKARDMTGFAVLLMGLLIGLSAWTGSHFAALQEQLSRVREEALAAEIPAREVERMVEIVRVVNERTDRRLEPVNVLAEIHRVVPAELRLESLDIDRKAGSLNLSGTAPTRKDVRTLVENLEQSGLLRDAAESGQTVRDNSGNFKFQVTARLE